MTRVALLVLAAVATVLAVPLSPAEGVTGGSGAGGFWGAAHKSQHGSQVTTPPGNVPTVTHPEGTYQQRNYCDQHGAALCYGGTVQCGDDQVLQESWWQVAGERVGYSVWCPSTSQPRAPTLTTGRILQAFKTIKLPAAPLVIQPPNGKTLVNFRTVFYTTQQPFNRAIRLLGHRVEFRIKPSEYTFLFGDGHWLTTEEPGRPFSTVDALDENITHKYLTKGTFHPSLNTTYSADFQVDGGAWRPVNGTVTIEGPKLDLETLTATPVLVD